MNPFDHLGIPGGSTRAGIKAAYRRLAMECHPDRNPGDGTAKARFGELTAAYHAALALTDGQAPAPSGGAHAGHGQPRRRRGRKRHEASITVEQAVQGCVLDVAESEGPCRGCGGEGHLKSRHVHPCETCGGSGVSGYRERGIIRVSVGCPDCAGSGRTTRIRCAECSGTGTRPGLAAEVEIPAGTRDGELFEVAGAFRDPSTGEAFDLEVVIRVVDHGGFRMVHGDVETDLRIDVWDAALGCLREVSGADGRRFRLQVPPGSRAGRRFRLKGQTLADGSRRDLVVRLDVAIPDAGSGKARAAFEALKAALEG